MPSPNSPITTTPVPPSPFPLATHLQATRERLSSTTMKPHEHERHEPTNNKRTPSCSRIGRKEEKQRIHKRALYSQLRRVSNTHSRTKPTHRSLEQAMHIPRSNPRNSQTRAPIHRTRSPLTSLTAKSRKGHLQEREQKTRESTDRRASEMRRSGRRRRSSGRSGSSA